MTKKRDKTTSLISNRELVKMSTYCFTNQIGNLAQVEIFEKLKLITSIMLRHNINTPEELEHRLRRSDPQRSVMCNATVAELLELKRQKEETTCANS